MEKIERKNAFRNFFLKKTLFFFVNTNIIFNFAK